MIASRFEAARNDGSRRPSGRLAAEEAHVDRRNGIGAQRDLREPLPFADLGGDDTTRAQPPSAMSTASRAVRGRKPF